ncbi:hypothetical protein Aduo_001775 [Ancylostoma duodenale]
MACQAGPSEAVVLRLKSRDISDVSLASSESSGCSSERSSILRSPVNLEETPVLHGTESSVSTDLPKPDVAGKESKASDAGTSSPPAVLPPPHLPKQNSRHFRDHPPSSGFREGHLEVLVQADDFSRTSHAVLAMISVPSSFFYFYIFI